MIGDPSGKSKTRPSLTLAETRQNGQSYFEQATKILSSQRVTMQYNSEWLDKMSFADVIRLASKYTVARMFGTGWFYNSIQSRRSDQCAWIPLPSGQAMDSVAIHAECRTWRDRSEVQSSGGKRYPAGIRPGAASDIDDAYPVQVPTVLKKMSKSLDNYIGVSDTPKEYLWQTLSIPDKLRFTSISNCWQLMFQQELLEIKKSFGQS